MRKPRYRYFLYVAFRAQTHKDWNAERVRRIVGQSPRFVGEGFGMRDMEFEFRDLQSRREVVKRLRSAKAPPKGQMIIVQSHIKSVIT